MVARKVEGRIVKEMRIEDDDANVYSFGEVCLARVDSMKDDCSREPVSVCGRQCRDFALGYERRWVASCRQAVACVGE